MSHQDYDIIIVGAGPAGASAALRLAAADIGLAERVLVLDRATFPRPKLCGGGVIREADRYLKFLGVAADVPSVPIHAIRVEYDGGSVTQRSPDMFRVVRREQFDHALVRAARARGVTVREGERVERFCRTTASIRLVTASGSYSARIVIGADGANSAVRRALVPGPAPKRFVALDTVARPAAPRADHTALFDFRPAEHGIRGYYWEFPCLCDGRPQINFGLAGQHWGGTLRDAFAGELGARGETVPLESIAGSSIPIYDAQLVQSAERVLLAGDAIGVDPWLGEGISVAIGTGMLAARVAAAALESGEFGFEDYGYAICRSACGQRLEENGANAERFYLAARTGQLARWFASPGTW